jgi:hypothetical protein
VAVAETTAAYRRMDQDAIAQWSRRTQATMKQIPDLHQRYPLSTTLEPLTPQWHHNPRAGLTGAVQPLCNCTRANARLTSPSPPTPSPPTAKPAGIGVSRDR